jgi:hypothetical protein
MRVNRASAFKIDPFLLPICIDCDGPMSLSYVEPASAYALEKRVFRCSGCSAEHPLPTQSDLA